MNNNRSLADEKFDQIDHALGRPTEPMAQTYRNCYAVNVGSLDEEEMEKSPHWSLIKKDDHLSYFRVTAEGRKALRAYLEDMP